VPGDLLGDIKRAKITPIALLDDGIDDTLV
jgi:hypothetical protein